MKLLSIAIALILCINGYGQAKKDKSTLEISKENPTLRETVLLLDSTQMTWVAQALQKGMEAWDNLDWMSTAEASKRKMYIANLINQIGLDYTKWYAKPVVVPKKDSTIKK